MATLRDIRRRIQAVRSTPKITSAMRMVAAAKLRRAQESVWAARPYVQKLREILSHVAATDAALLHPFFGIRREVNAIGLVVIAADRGLCGSFNSNVLRAAQQHLEHLRQQFPKARLELLALGGRAVNYLRKYAAELLGYERPGLFSPLRMESAYEIAHFLMDAYLAGRYDRIEVLSNEFRSVLRQEVCHRVLLPITAPQRQAQRVDYIFEPSQLEILDALLPMYVRVQFWQLLLESHTAEQAARMLAMENATNNARELIRHLQLQYNKERQAAITKEMVEIASGAEALRSQG
jgi:F-type H+-transporting ATPase subunit gamma